MNLARFKSVRTDNTTFFNINDWKRTFFNSFSELLNEFLVFGEKYLYMSRSLYRHMILYINA